MSALIGLGRQTDTNDEDSNSSKSCTERIHGRKEFVAKRDDDEGKHAKPVEDQHELPGLPVVIWQEDANASGKKRSKAKVDG